MVERIYDLEMMIILRVYHDNQRLISTSKNMTTDKISNSRELFWIWTHKCKKSSFLYIWSTFIMYVVIFKIVQHTQQTITYRSSSEEHVRTLFVEIWKTICRIHGRIFLKLYCHDVVCGRHVFQLLAVKISQTIVLSLCLTHSGIWCPPMYSVETEKISILITICISIFKNFHR